MRHAIAEALRFTRQSKSPRLPMGWRMPAPLMERLCCRPIFACWQRRDRAHEFLPACLRMPAGEEAGTRSNQRRPLIEAGMGFRFRSGSSCGKRWLSGRKTTARHSASSPPGIDLVVETLTSARRFEVREPSVSSGAIPRADSTKVLERAEGSLRANRSRSGDRRHLPRSPSSRG